MERRRHTYTKKNSAPARSSGLWTALIVILSLVLIAAILVLSPVGGFLLDKVVIPVYGCISGPSKDKEIAETLQQQDEKIGWIPLSPKPTEKAAETISIEETPFYILQMGVFADENAAKSHADEIKRLGAAGVIYPQGSVFRVFAAAYTDETSLMKVQEQVRKDGFEASPYITEKHMLKVTAGGDDKAIQSLREAVTLINTVPEQLCRFALSYDKNECSAQQLLTEIKEYAQNCAQAAKAFESTKDEAVKSIAALIEKYEEKLSTFLKEHDTIHTETLSGDLKSLQLSIIMDYILFFDRK